MKHIILLSLLIISAGAFCQTDFLVYQVKGKVYSAEKGDWKNLKVGQSLKRRDLLNMETDAAVVLLCRNYQPFIIRQTGKIKLDTFSNQCSRTDPSISEAYFKYVWQEFTHPHTSVETDRKKYMKNTGGARRGCPGITIDPLFDSLYIQKGGFSISWQTTISNSKLRLAIYDQDQGGVPIREFSVKNNHFPVDSLIPFVSENNILYWTLLKDGDETCDRNYIQVMNEADYRKAIAAISMPEWLVEGPEADLYIGVIMEEHHFPMEAYKHYQKAVKTTPQNNKYNNFFSEFQYLLGLR